MSLFIVLWLVSSSDKVKKAVGGYFNDPKGAIKDAGSGARGSGGESVTVKKDDMKKLKDKLEQAVRNSAALQKIKEHVVFTVTNEGLRVELLEGDDSTFFESGSPLPTEFGKDLLRKLAEEIGKLPNKVTVEGHTDSRPYLGRVDYSNWELSADRANAARRLCSTPVYGKIRSLRYADLPIKVCETRPIRRMAPTGALRSSFNIKTIRSRPPNRPLPLTVRPGRLRPPRRPRPRHPLRRTAEEGRAAGFRPRRCDAVTIMKTSPQ